MTLRASVEFQFAVGPAMARFESVVGGLTPLARTTIHQTLDTCAAALGRALDSGEISPADREELERHGLGLSSLVQWDLIDLLTRSFLREVLARAQDAGLSDLPDLAERTVAVTDAVYDGFWVFNDRSGFEQALRVGGLADHFPVPTFMADSSSRLTFVNAAFAELFGRSLHEYSGVPFADLLGVAIDVGVGADRVPLHLGESGVRYVSVMTTAVHTEAGTEYFGQLLDRTEEVRLERTKAQVIATIAHELRTPLTTVVGFVDLLRNGDLAPAGMSAAEAFDVIHEQSEHLLSLVTDLVDFAKLDTGNMRLDIGDVRLRDAICACIRRIADESLDVRLEIPDDTSVAADRVRIEQLFTNLFNNSRRHGGRTITVEPCAGPRGFVGIRVADDGPGIAPEDRDRIFQSFYRGSVGHVGEGSGLGLAICKAIVSAHGGRIELEPGPGASFAITLPGSRPHG